jgi:transposase
MDSGASAAVEDIEAVAKKEEWTVADARLLIVAQKTSGMTVVDFAARHGFIPQRLHRWKGKLRQQEKAPKAPVRASKTFVPVQLVGPRRAGEGTLEVVVRGGRSVRVGSDFDAGLLQRVVAALEASC